MKKLTIIMPALNEELNIREAVLDALRTVEKDGLDAELIIVNDGSADKTADVIQGCISKDSSRIKVINHEKPEGIRSEEHTSELQSH